MPSFTSAKALKTELAKSAKLSSITKSLPQLLKPAPAAAIALGGVLARKTESDNAIESWILGPDEAMCLGPPSTPMTGISTRSTQYHRQPVNGPYSMCGTCHPKRMGLGTLLSADQSAMLYRFSKNKWRDGAEMPLFSSIGVKQLPTNDVSVFGFRLR